MWFFLLRVKTNPTVFKPVPSYILSIWLEVNVLLKVGLLERGLGRLLSSIVVLPLWGMFLQGDLFLFENSNICSLSQQKSHIPYRNSKLTHFLQDSLGGDAKMLLLITVHPGEDFLRETIHTLNFGLNARQTTRGAAIKHTQVKQKEKKKIPK